MEYEILLFCNAMGVAIVVMTVLYHFIRKNISFSLPKSLLDVGTTKDKRVAQTAE